ncbi:Hypothetical protein NTJ_00416 [Nesidiocoris tenuis]|uniref:Uncharacterized protein n=1 Tax=Nesidiocoris tenuis TaxID=355587 RepID=A0ABN7A635_9HEMI|nr:Hypothetical protein NTJ_00416 [Nesidiocoris tenuis]
MGACFGLCKKKSKPNRYLSLRKCVYLPGQDKVELELLVEEGLEDMTDEELDIDVWTMSKGELALLSAEKLKKPSGVGTARSAKNKNDSGSYDAFEGQQMMALDAHSLLASRAVQNRTASCCSSTPPSSIDLEWETESVLQAVPVRPKSTGVSNAEDGGSSCSGGGGVSPESLEWDPCNDANATDYETDQLIREIEMLTSRALQETGGCLKRES